MRLLPRAYAERLCAIALFCVGDVLTVVTDDPLDLRLLAACAVPTAPEASQTSCLAGKVPYARCATSDFVNPLGDFVNPLGDDTTKTGP